MDRETRVHVIMLTVAKIIIYQKSAETSLINLSGLRLLTLHLHLLLPPLVLLLCNFFSQTMSIFLATDCSSISIS